MRQEQRFSLEELAEQTGLSTRTIRFYISQGLVPGPGTRGKGTAYGEEHFLRLKLIRRLSEEGMRLSEIRRRVTGLSLPELNDLLSETELRHRTLAEADASLSPKDYIAALLAEESTPYQQSIAPSLPVPRKAVRSEEWHRWELAPGLELSVRSDLRRRYDGLIRKLFEVVERS